MLKEIIMNKVIGEFMKKDEKIVKEAKAQCLEIVTIVERNLEGSINNAKSIAVENVICDLQESIRKDKSLYMEANERLMKFRKGRKELRLAIERDIDIIVKKMYLYIELIDVLRDLLAGKVEANKIVKEYKIRVIEADL